MRCRHVNDFSFPARAETGTAEQRFVIGSISWDAYVTISDTLDELIGVRMIYNDGRLILMGKARRHEWLSHCLGHLVMGIASLLGIPCEPAGEAAYRSRERKAGLEGDRTFHLRVNAERMRGGRNYDFTADPPPDLAIEVKVSHPPDDAIEAWGRVGVPEVWRFDAASFTCSFWKLRDDESYEPTDRSVALPMLSPNDVAELIELAQATGTAPWLAQLPNWVDRVIRPRLEQGA
jgi:Uma2 family endonuclease